MWCVVGGGGGGGGVGQAFHNAAHEAMTRDPFEFPFPFSLLPVTFKLHLF